MKQGWMVWTVVLALLLATLAACGPAGSDVEEGANEGEKEITTASGLQYTEIEAGDGLAPQPGDIVSVHYRGTLEDGTEFDSSYSRGEPIQFPLGRGMVIPGWDEGIALMTVGGKARLVIPPDLAYGDQGAGGVIPPGATLTFEVELVEILPGSPDAPTEVGEADYVTTDSGLKYYDLEVGDGASPEVGQSVAVHYTGWLEDGTKFDSSLDRGQPFTFPLGMRQVIPGWDEGVATMKVGGRRQLVIPPELGYGQQGAGGVIPPNATLIFEVELLEVR
jgi:peptidylprolyl isomerase